MTPFKDFAINDPVKTTRDQFAAAWAGMSAADANFVRDMHTYNGLIGACISATRTIEQIDDSLVDLARALTCANRPKDIVIAGDSVHFDLDWIRVHLPKFAACLSHRVYNVSTLKACARTWGAWPERLKKDEAHRAMSDVLASLEAAKIFKVDYRARIEAAKAWQKSQVSYIAAGPIPIGVCVAACPGTYEAWVELGPTKRGAPLPADHCTFPTDGSAQGRGVVEHDGVLYPMPDPGPDHEICGKAEAKADPCAQYQTHDEGRWEGHWNQIKFCQHDPDVVYAFRRPKAIASPDPGPDHELISADEAKKDKCAQYKVYVTSENTWDSGWQATHFCSYSNKYIYAFRRPKAKWVACTRAEAHAFGGQSRRGGANWIDFDHTRVPPYGPVAYRVDATRTNELSPVVVVPLDLFRKMAPVKGMLLSKERYAVDREMIPVGTYLG